MLAPGSTYGHALSAACAADNLDIVTEILAHNDVHLNAQADDGRTALHFACNRRSTRISQMLLKSGADVEVESGEYGTALHEAILWPDVENVRLLLQHGVDLNRAHPLRGTPLLCAVTARHYQTATITKLLVEHGADVNLPSLGQSYPLLSAIEKKDHYAVELLLEHGARLDVFREDGQDALTLCRSLGDDAMLNLILLASTQAGASVDCADIGEMGCRNVPLVEHDLPA